jgi:hypothetical protein
MKSFFSPSPAQDPSNFQTINYKHDVYDRRSEKKVDGFSTRYLYDGGHVIAKYDGNNNLMHIYIYGHVAAEVKDHPNPNMFVG